jgi:uncharacterized protein YjbI with pentapeptide repeats
MRSCSASWRTTSNGWKAGRDPADPDHLRADLSRASLAEAQLREVQLSGARLQGAILYKAQLQGANLTAARLQGAMLWEARLQGAILYNAQLQGAFLSKANFRGADLRGANLERLLITEDGEPGQDRRAVNLTDADLRDADLRNAQLSTVAGLRTEQLAGAVLTNAKLPEDVAKFDQLKHVEETSKNATTVFFGLLAASLYSWLTIATTTDVALITGTASSPLPIINTNIALSGFYLAAPLILLAVYFYFHLYLQRLWRCLASLPAEFPDGSALDDKAYPWLLNGLVRRHFANLRIFQRPLTTVENVVSILLAWWVVPFTLLAFWFRYVPMHDWWVTALHVALATIAFGFGVRSYRLAVRTLSGADEHSAPEQDEPLWSLVRRGIRSYWPDRWTIFASSLAVVLSVWAAIVPGDDLQAMLGYKTSADLRDDDVSTKPSGWTGRKETADVEIAQVKGADLEGRDLRDAEANGVFLVKAKLVEANLRGASLRKADLRGADLSYADLKGANLAGDLSGALLVRADLRDAHLGGANLSDADLSGADLTGANLRLANLTGTVFRGTILSGAKLSYKGSDFIDSRGVTQAQLNQACGDDTQLPKGLTISRCPEEAPQPSPEP